MSIRKIVLGSMLLMLSACAEQGAGPVISSGDRYVRGADIASEYRLGVSDRVRIVVFNEPTLSGEFSVGAAGTLSLPLIGEVEAQDRTVRDVTNAVQQRLADGYLRSPRVSAEIIVYRPLYIIGEVSNAGQYPYASGMTALNAIALARGFTPRANRDVVTIQRQGEKEAANYRLTPDLLIYPGDTIRVGERFF